MQANPRRVHSGSGLQPGGRRRHERPRCTANTTAEASGKVSETEPASAFSCPDKFVLLADAELIKETQAGNLQAFEELVHRHDKAVLRLALHLMGCEEAAQDVYQEAFLKAYRNVGKFRFECSFYTWMYRIVTNLCLDHLRNRRARREDAHVVINVNGEEHDILDTVADTRPGSSPDRELQRQEIRTRVRYALQKLTARERVVFEMKHYQGLKLHTLGQILNTTEDTVKSTLFRATQKLRRMLADVR